MKSSICNFFSFSFLYFCVFILSVSVAISLKMWDVFLSLMRDSLLMLERGIFVTVQQECRRKERSFFSPTSEWWLKYENTACFSLRSAVNSSRCGALYMSVLTQGTLVQPALMQSHLALTPVVLVISSTPHIECAYLSPLRNVALLYNTVSACVVPNREFVILPTRCGLISTFALWIRSMLINNENTHAKGIFKLHE